MAANLIKKGTNVFLFDVNQSAIDLVTKNVSADPTAVSRTKACKTPAEAVAQADVIITMLPTPEIVRNVVTSGSDAVIRHAKRGALLIDSSTIDPATVKSVGDHCATASIEMVDAPVSGGVGGANAGTLTFMVGGQVNSFQRAKPILEQMGKNIVHCGELGSGQVAKICNNLVLGISMGAVSEAMNLGVRLGVDPKILASIINTSSGRCWSSDTYNPCPGVMPNVPSSNEYKGGFAVDLMLKDMRLAVQAAEAAGQVLPLGTEATKLYTTVSQNGDGKKDFSYIFQFLKNLRR